MSTMNSERTQAYGRVIKTLDDLGPAKLQPGEQDRIRDAADEARAAMEEVDALVEHLVVTGRWTTERGQELLHDLLGCGPVSPVA